MPSLGFAKGPRRGPQILRGTVTIDPPSLTTGTKNSVSVTIAGVKITDIVILEPPSTLEAGLVYQGCRAKAGGADVDIANPTAGTIDGASKTWTYKIIKAA